ncbi:hypothetical protein ACFL0O_05895, partial [Thermodesulfobacteriota bacterium]
LGKIGMLAPQVAPFNPVRCNSGIFHHNQRLFEASKIFYRLNIGEFARVVCVGLWRKKLNR